MKKNYTFVTNILNFEIFKSKKMNFKSDETNG